MRKSILYLFLAALAVFSVACAPEEVVFGIDTNSINAGPEGGNYPLRLSSGEEWVAMSSEPWIAISPANGRGSVDCMVMIDSTLLNDSRGGEVRIQTAGGTKTISINQTGFDHMIQPRKDLVEIKDFEVLDKRKFQVNVSTNVDFEVVIPDEHKQWLTCKMPEIVLDRGARPRNVTLTFEWKVNPNADKREADVDLMAQIDGKSVSSILKVSQGGAPDIEGYVEKGDLIAADSLALLSINRFLGCWTEYDTSLRMERWDGVTLHKSGPHKGRVKSVQFTFFETNEPVPYAVKYLTAAEELNFFSNVNSFNKSLSVGEDICNLTQLKKLTLFAYGLTELPESMANMTSLRYLDLSGNNFETIPQVLRKCESLTALFLSSNQRNSISDLSNTVKKDFGGLFGECPADGSGNRKFPQWILEWDQLDTLRLSVNYLQGELPTDEELIATGQFEAWSADELKDSLGTEGIRYFTENKVAKVLPETDFLAINLNRLHGTLPRWLKYHPKLDWWTPLSLVFPQEGKTVEGKPAGFTDEPTNLNYYYELYSEKKLSKSYGND